MEGNTTLHLVTKGGEGHFTIRGAGGRESKILVITLVKGSMNTVILRKMISHNTMFSHRISLPSSPCGIGQPKHIWESSCRGLFPHPVLRNY